MCQAADNTTPWFFTKFSDLFALYICKDYPELPETNYAIAKHTSHFCPIESEHWHLMILDYEFRKNAFKVQCPYSTFRLLILENENYEYNGDLFLELHLAILYGETIDAISIDECYLKLPNLAPEESFIHKMCKVAAGDYANEFHEILRIFLQGKGSFTTDTDKLCLSLNIK